MSMFSSDKNIQKVNAYFHKFIFNGENYLLEKENLLFGNVTTLLYHQDWNWMMYLIHTIQRRNVVRLLHIDMHENWCRFYSRDGTGTIHQDKGRNLLEAMYTCCYVLLCKYWKGEKPPRVSMSVEPFTVDEVDDGVKETYESTIEKIEKAATIEDDFNDEGFKEAGSKAFFKTLTDEQLTSMYNVTRIQNPHLPKLIQWLKEELESRKIK